jgi:hypothetical protein
MDRGLALGVSCRVSGDGRSQSRHIRNCTSPRLERTSKLDFDNAIIRVCEQRPLSQIHTLNDQPLCSSRYPWFAKMLREREQ